MNFLDMTKNFEKNYDWYRGCSGSWHHWMKKVLGGEITLHVQGSDEQDGYWGEIILGDDVHENKIIYTTKTEGIHVPFKTPENCALTLDNAWKEIIKKEHNGSS